MIPGETRAAKGDIELMEGVSEMIPEIQALQKLVTVHNPIA